MASRFNPLALLERLRSTYWFLPALVTGAAVVLGLVLVEVDRAFPDATGWLGWAYGGGADGARSLLSAVAGSTITVVSVTFSVMVVALTVSSQHFGPRLLNSFMRDNAAQFVLGTYTGTFAYCLVVLRTVQGDSGDNYSLFVPHLAVTAAVLLTLFSVAMLIYYVHHVALSMQVSEITAGVAHEMERVVGRLYPEHFGEGTEPPVHEPPAVPPGAMVIRARTSGYVQEIDNEAVLKLAGRHDSTVWLLSRPGQFVVEGTSIAAAHPPPLEGDELERSVSRAYVIGTDRSTYQDIAFAVQQLVEVALRALSPGVNEPFTAITAIDRLGQGLAKLASRKIPSGVRVDDDGVVRVITRPRTFEELVEGAFVPLAPQAGGDPAVAERLFETLILLADRSRRPEDRAAIRRVSDLLWSSAAGHVESDGHRSSLERRRDEVLRSLDRGPR